MKDCMTGRIKRVLLAVVPGVLLLPVCGDDGKATDESTAAGGGDTT